MDIRKVKKLIELLDESNIQEIEIHEGEESVRISRGNGAVVMQAPAPQAVAAAPVDDLQNDDKVAEHIEDYYTYFVK